jgi:hypothetical protein
MVSSQLLQSIALQLASFSKHIDALFPVLPLWFTSPLRSRARRALSMHLPDGTHRSSYPPVPDTLFAEEQPHDHALLEYLYSSVFDHRFINTKPSGAFISRNLASNSQITTHVILAVIPNYVSMYFTHITLGPVLCFSMPPLPPLQPLPPQEKNRMSLFSLPSVARDRASTVVSMSDASSTTIGRPSSSSFSSILSGTTANSISTVTFAGDAICPERSRSLDSAYDAQTINGHHSSKCQIYFLDNSLEESPVGNSSGGLLSINKLDSLNERFLAMQLYHSYQSVLSCQEAMWEVLKDRIRNRREELLTYGWDDDEEIAELQSRKKFEKLVDRYRK